MIGKTINTDSLRYLRDGEMSRNMEFCRTEHVAREWQIAKAVFNTSPAQNERTAQAADLPRSS
jgi:hypothetical protein